MTDVKQVGVKRPNNVRFVFWQEIMNNDVQVCFCYAAHNINIISPLLSIVFCPVMLA